MLRRQQGATNKVWSITPDPCVHLQMLTALLHLHSGKSGSGDATTKGWTRTGRGMDEGPAFNPNNGGVRRVGIGAKGDYKGNGVHSDGI